MNVRKLPMCAKSCTVGPQQYTPTFLPAGSSGANSDSERVNVLKNFRPMLTMARQGKGAGAKGKRISGSKIFRSARAVRHAPLFLSGPNGRRDSRLPGLAGAAGGKTKTPPPGSKIFHRPPPEHPT